MVGQCRQCKHLLGCPLLLGSNKVFDETLLLNEEDPPCSSFEEVVGAREKNVREWCYASFGLGYLRALHGLPELMMEGLRQGEKDEQMYENIPDFSDPILLREGMTAVDREEVLRYQTDENGQVIIEKDSEGVEHKLARPEYHIKAYACDPDRPIGLEKEVAWAWNINQIIDHILKREAELGLVVKVRKSAKKPANQPQESEKSMAGREVRTTIRRGPPSSTPQAPAPSTQAPVQQAPASVQAPAPRANPRPPAASAQGPRPMPRPAPAASGGRVANPPTRRSPTPSAGPARAPAPSAPPSGGSVATQGPGISEESLVALVEQCVAKTLDIRVKDILEKAQKNYDLTASCCEKILDAITIVHDIAGQTGGTFQIKRVDAENNYLVKPDGTFEMEAPQLFPHPSKVFAYVEGSAYDPENMQAVDADLPQEYYDDTAAPGGEYAQEGEA